MKNPQPLSLSRDGFNYKRPVTLPDLLKIKAAQGPTGATFRLICGNTAVGIYPDKPNYQEKVLHPTTWVDVSAIPALQQVSFQKEGIQVGGQITIARLMDILKAQIGCEEAAKTRGFVALLDHLKHVANTQIRNEASLAGNIYIGTNQGFLSDFVLVLGALGAQVHVATLQDEDTAYNILELPKDAELAPEAVYTSISIPYTNEQDHVFSYKIRRRKDDCHAIVNAAFKVSLEDGMVTSSTLVVNGIKAEATPLGVMFHPILLTGTSKEIAGKAWNEATLAAALKTLFREVEAHDPKLGLIDQISFAYRKSLAENLFYKFYVEVAMATDVAVDCSIADSIPPEKPVVSRGEQFYNSYPEEAPVSEPYVRLAAFMQATGEANYTKVNGLPPFTAEAAFVYSLHPKGRFNYVLPLTTAHGRKGKRVTAAQLAEFLVDWNKDFIDLVTYADIPNPAANWVGLGGDDPIFVPSKDDVIPDEIKQNGLGSKYKVGDSFYYYFEPAKFTCIGAPLALIVAADHDKARDIAIYVRNNCIDWDLDTPEFFQEALNNKHFFPQNPDASPGMTHLEDITRPGTAAASSNGRIVEGEHATGYQNHFYMETMNTVAVPDENKSMILHTATQNLADNQSAAANALGIRANKVKVTLTREGGGFGGRQTRSRFNSTASAIAAWKLNRPIHLNMDRETNFIMCGNRHPFVGKYRSNCDTDGKIMDLEINYFSNGGNTYDMSFPVLDLAVMSADNVYSIPNFKVTGEVVRSNEISNTAFRSFGMVQGINILEEAIEHTAFKAGIDPETLREKNFYRTGTTEWTEFKITEQTLGALEVFRMDKKMIAQLKTIKGNLYKDEEAFATAIRQLLPTISLPDMITLKDYATLSWDYTPFMQPLKWCKIQRLWDDLKETSNLDARKQAIVEFNATNRWRKRGICMIPLKYGISYTGPRGTLDQGGAYVIAYSDDGSLLVHHGGVEMGQGIDTKMAQIAAETLGIDLSLVRIANTDTQTVGDASPTAASTGSDLNGGAVQLACKELRERLEKFCEDLEQYTLYFTEYDGTSVDSSTAQQIDTVVRNWRSHWSECWPMIVSLAYANRINLSSEARYKSPHYSVVDVNHRFGRPFFYFTYAAAASEVEVDILTGEFTLLQSDLLFDVGKSLNPLVDVGQIEGGFIQGVGYVTTEELLKQQDGEAEIPGVPNGAITSVNTWQYKPPGAKAIPQQFNVHIFDNSDMKSNSSKNPHLDATAVKSSKGIGEPPLVLGNTVFFAIKRAILAFYEQQGYEDWCDMTAPATVAKIQSACQMAIKQEDLVL
jgi:xanthine dehydrogenase molybdopterin-binding subunit B/CO/xanthine dehydrogenase FAD-binding subunit